MPDFEVTSPDGKKFVVTAPDGASQEQVLAYAQSQFAPQAPQQPQVQQPQQPQQENTWGNAIKNVGEAGLQAATGAVGGLVGDIAGLGALGYDITANAVMHPFSGSEPSQYADPAAVRERVAGALTYQPENPESLSSKIVQAPGKVISGAGDYLGQQADDAGYYNTAHILRAVPLAAASALGVKAAKGPTFNASKMGGPASMAVPRRAPGTPAPPAPEPTPEQVAIKNATDIGLKLPPSAVGNKVGNIAEGLSGRAPLARKLSMDNAKAVDAAAGKAIGVADKPVNRATIGVERAKANRAYDAIAKTGKRKVSDEFRKEVAEIDDRSGGGSFADDAPPQVEALKTAYGKQQAFDAADAVARIRKLRADARLNFKARDPDKAAIAHVQQKIADALDVELERHADALGKPQLASDYKAARVQLAKLRTVEESLAGNSVSARKIWQQWKRGAPLSGELLAIAKAFDSFPNVLQDANKIAGTHPFSVVDGLVAGAGAAGGALGNPALLATVAARPATRAFLASERYQRRNVRPQGRAATETKPRVAAPAVAVTAPEERRKTR